MTYNVWSGVGLFNDAV